MWGGGRCGEITHLRVREEYLKEAGHNREEGCRIAKTAGEHAASLAAMRDRADELRGRLQVDERRALRKDEHEEAEEDSVPAGALQILACVQVDA